MACEQGAGAVHRYPIYSTSFRSKILTSLIICPRKLYTFKACLRLVRLVGSFHFRFDVASKLTASQLSSAE
jgi:hypothetical protein